MGLDIVDFVFRAENEFGVDLNFDDVSALFQEQQRDYYAGDVFGLVLQHLEAKEAIQGDYSANLNLWRELQQNIQQATHIPLEQIELQASLDVLFPRSRRYKLWKAFQKLTPYKIPELGYPFGFHFFGVCLILAIVFYEVTQLWRALPFQGVGSLLLICILGGFLFLHSYTTLLAPFQTRFSSGMATVKDLARWVLQKNYLQEGRRLTPTKPSIGEQTEKDWRRFTKTLEEVSGVDASLITPQTRLIRDLGMN